MQHFAAVLASPETNWTETVQRNGHNADDNLGEKFGENLNIFSLEQ
jgi:hypothetical protein